MLIIRRLQIKFNPKEEDHWEFFFRALDSLIIKAEKKKGYKSIVLILDEVNAIKKWSEFRDVLIKLRAYAQKSKGFNLLIGSAYPVYQLTQDEWSPFFNIFYPITLIGLSDEEAVELVRNPALEVNVYYSDDSIDLIKKLTGNKPYYIQVLCTKIFEKLLKQGTVKNIIQKDQVEDAIDDAIELLDNHFTLLNNNCTEKQQNFMQLVIQNNKDEIERLASEHKNKQELHLLRERGMIHIEKDGYHADGLMKKWLLRV